MNGLKILQVNKIPEREDCVIRIPRNVYASGDIPGTAKFLGGEISSYSSADKICYRSINTFREHLGFSPASISRGIKKLVDGGYISREGQGKFKYSLSDEKKLYLRLEVCMLKYAFELCAVPERNKPLEVRKLKNSEALVFAWFYTRANDKELKDGLVEASVGKIADELKLNEKTVRLAIYVLRRAKLIIRQAQGKCTNAPSTYKLNERLYKRIKKAHRKPKKTDKAIAEADKAIAEEERAQAEREERERFEYYEGKRHYYVSLLERNERIASADAEYCARDKEYRRLTIEYGKAEGLELPSAPALKLKYEEARRLRAQTLARLGLTERDLELQYSCTTCKDTGTDERGRICDCYRRPPNVASERKGR